MLTSPDPLGLALDTYQVIERISSKSRSIRIEVRSASEVRLVIPRFVSRQVARDFLRSREAWIRQKIAEFRQREVRDAASGPSPHLRWDGSDRLPLRGGSVPLQLIPAQLRQPALRHDERGLTLFCAPAWLDEPARLEGVVRDWLKREALKDARALLWGEAVRLGVSFRGPRIADQKTLWGSCTPDGLISLSWRLVLTPPEAFRYVVVHELCHRIHLDHSEAFWSLVGRQMPGYDAQRQWLRENGQRLHAYLRTR